MTSRHCPSSDPSFGIPPLVFSYESIETTGDSGRYTDSLLESHSSEMEETQERHELCPVHSPNRKLFMVMFVLITLVKLLLTPSYVSTDFDVHQHWLWLTHHLPLSQWYTDISSQWTLDYPPLFAWFEWVVSQLIAPLCPDLIAQHSTPLRTLDAVFWHRVTVILADLIFVFGCYHYWLWWSIVQVRRPQSVRDQLFSPTLAVAFLLIWNPALLLLDHIHFQYNGMLTGLLLLAITLILNQRPTSGAILFAFLLNLKHLYLYVAPAFFVYLLRTHCTIDNRLQLTRLVVMGSQVTAVFACSLAPFAYHNQLSTLLSRLFPFQRGLSHAYWAPNVWALYNAADRLACRLIPSNQTCASTRTTGGLVNDFQHHILPNITPRVCAVLTLLSILVIHSLCALHWSFAHPFSLSLSFGICSADLGRFVAGPDSARLPPQLHPLCLRIVPVWLACA
jgi:alpha-1,3-glucosyltransferase